MGRKSNVQKELEKQQKELNEILAKEKAIRDEAKLAIDGITKDKLFCGVMLNKEDILGILTLFLNTNEPVKVNYELYNIEEE